MGTRLAELNGGIVNSLLGAAWGSSVSLSAFDYQSLLATNVSLFAFLDNLSTDIAPGLTYQQLADTNVTMNQVLQALIETTDAGGADQASLALQSLLANLPAGTAMPLGDIVDFSGLYGRSVGGVIEVADDNPSVNAFGLLMAGTQNTLAGQVTDIGTGVSVPLSNTSVATRIATNKPMAYVANARPGRSLQSAQVRIALTATLTDIDLLVTSAKIQVPLYLEMAPGEAKLTDMPCVPGDVRAMMAARSGALSLQFGTVTDAALRDFSRPVTPATAPILDISLLGIPIQVRASGSAKALDSQTMPVPFTQNDIDNGRVKSVGNGGGAPFAALADDLTLSTSILGNPGLVGLLFNDQLDTLTGALKPVVAGLLDKLDDPVNALLTTLGLQLGIIDLRMYDARCRVPTLVG
jgi:uncharacterized membrane protein